MSPPRAVLRVTALLALSLGLAACSMPQLAYRNADWLVARYADDYVELTESRKAAWRPVLERELGLHRSHELPQVVAFLERAGAAAADGLTAGEVACLRDQAGTLYRRHAAVAARIAAPLLASVGPAELPALREAFREHNAEYRDEYLGGTSESRLDQRVERFVDQLERWTGWLQNDQKALVRSHVARWPDLAPDWHAYRYERQQQLLRLLAQGAGPAEVERFLRRWWQDMEGAYPSLVAKREALTDGIGRLLVVLSTTFDDDQQRTLARRTGGLAEDLAALVPDGAREPVRLAGTLCRSIDGLMSAAGEAGP